RFSRDWSSDVCSSDLEGDEKALASGGSIWPHVDRAIVEEVLRHRSTIVFANSRRLAERITASMNEIYLETLDAGFETPPAAAPRSEERRVGKEGRSE